MHLTVNGKQLDVGDALRTHVGDTLNGLIGKYFSRPIDANVVMSRDAHLFTADITVHVGRNILLHSQAEATEPYPAFDRAADRLAKRLRRYKRRLRDHHRSGGAAAGDDTLASAAPLPARQYVLEAEPEDAHRDDGASETRPDSDSQPVIIAEMLTDIETMTVSEAVMRMDLADLPALMFRNSTHGGLNMVYRRTDGHIGWVDPQGSEGAGA